MVDNSNSYKDRVSRLISWGHWFMFANILLAMLMAVRYIFAADGQATFISVFYVLMTWVGHFGLLGIICYVLVLFPLTFVFPYSHILRGVGAVLATLSIVALLIDGSVYQNYQLHFNLFAFDLDGFNLNNTIGWSSISLFLIALLVVELTIANLIWKRLHIIRQWDIGNKVTAFFGAMFLLSHVVHIWADATIYRPVLSFDRMFPFAHQSTARSFIKRQGWLDETHQKDLMINKSAKSVVYPLSPLQCHATDTNLLIITIARVNEDLVTQQIMPNLAMLSSQGLSAQNHITNSLGDDDANFGFETGLPAIYRPAFTTQKLSSPLIELTNQSIRKRFGVHIDQLPQEDALTVDKGNVASLSQWISEQRGAPYFANITLYASQELSIGTNALLNFDHALTQTSSAPQRVLATQYVNSLHYTDKLIGELLKAVDLTTTTVVVTGHRGNDLTRLYNQSSSDYSQVNLKVPLVIVGPNFETQKVNKATSHYDVLPTLLKSHFKCGNPASDVSVGYDIKSTQKSDMFYLGNAHYFSLYKDGNNTQIDRQGQYRFFDKHYIRQDDGKLSFQSLVDLMANIERFEP